MKIIPDYPTRKVHVQLLYVTEWEQCVLVSQLFFIVDIMSYMLALRTRCTIKHIF